MHKRFLLKIIFFSYPIGTCSLFDVACDADDGFVININNTCKDIQYSQLPADNAGIFITASDLASDGKPDIKTLMSNLDGNCSFDGIILKFLPQ